MRAGILGPREVFFFVPEGLSRRPCYSSELLELTVILSHLCCLFILPQAEADATYGALWPWGWRVWAWLRPIFSEPLFLMAMRLTGRGMSSTNFSKSLSAVSVANGMNQSHGMSRTHGMSFTNCRRGQYKPRAIFFIFLSKSCREFISWRDLNIRQKPK